MFFDNQYRDNQPLGRIGAMPVYLTTIIVAIIVAGLIFSAIAGAYNALALFAFEPELAWRHGQVWRAVSYLAVDQVNFFTIFNLLFLYSFGRDCEREMGRGRYSVFLGLLVFTPVLIATVLWCVGIGGGVAGSVHLSMGLVIAFATIYPNIPWWAEIPMKFVAIGCMFLAAVGHLSQRDQVGLGATLTTCAVSFGYIRGMRAGLFTGFSWTEIFRRKPKLRVLPPLEQKSRSPGRPSGTSDEVDALLDKIAKSGLQSLTAKEKSRLQAAREELLKKDRK
ncbi:MAG TPA: rhomboid family intramembrane serine protease [Candidatus Didemnitutus sp.]|nr:rhomboid family intramembrane serine protease [Candidatus Didemnitutus sp.]